VPRIEEDRPVRIRHLVAGTMAVLLVGAAPASAAFPGANGRNAYEGYQKLETINAVGGDRKPLIGQAGMNFAAPAWSADGQRLAFASIPDGADFEIFVTEGAGAEDPEDFALVRAARREEAQPLPAGLSGVRAARRARPAR